MAGKLEMDTLSDKQLVTLIKKGNAHAFTIVYERYWKRLYVYAFKIFEDEHVCEDILQEVFVNLWERSTSVDINHLESYLLQSVKYKVSNSIRNLRVTVSHENMLASLGSSPDSSQLMIAKEVDSEINGLVNQLPEKCRQVFVMSRNDKYSNQEIADTLGLSVRTVERHIYNALLILKKNLV